jgi:hypothetical protein
MRRISVAFTVLVLAHMSFAADEPRPIEMSSMGRLAMKKVVAIGNANANVSDPPTDRCVNEPDCESTEGPAETQAETSIAVDSTGQHVVIAFNDFRGFLTSTTSISGFMYSDDAGATFVDGGQLPVGPTVAIGSDLFPQVLGDPDVKYLGGCNFVYSSLLLKGFSATQVVETLAIHRSTDCGHTWAGPFEVTPATNPNGLLDVNGAPEDFADKELGDVDPDTGRYGLCWSNFTPAAPGGVEISCTYSDNVLSGTPTFSPRRVVAAALADGQGASLRFAGNGSPNAYVVWSRFSGLTNNVGLARSTDNGVTWSAPVNLTTNFITMDEVLGNDRVHNFPTVAVDRSSSPFQGNVYVVYANNNSRDGADVAFQKSTNGGINFSAPILLNARPGNDRAQWFPYVTVDTTGRVWVFYYDQGVATSGDLTEVTYLYSDDGGSTWSAPVPLTPRPFKAGWGNDTGQPNLGDYNQAVAQSGILFASYAGTSLVGFADGQPSTALTTPDVRFGKVATGASKAPLHTGAVTFAESGADGNIDPGDQVRLTIPLINYVTNPLNAGTMSSISATLSTTTAGVTVTQTTSTYPDIVPGASAVNGTDFILQLSSTFVPGTSIELSLAVSSTQGSTTLLLTQPTGTPVYASLLSENFDGVSPGTLPAGWSAAHGDGLNTVPWTTSNSFATSLCGSSNKAFHPNANDGPGTSSPTRWERLFSPIVNIPANSQYVTLDFDVCYDTEDDPNFRILAYDGFFLRITDQTPGRTLRSVLAEAFEEEFTTDGFQHYPKHFPRSGDPNYFDDMSAWAGFSNGTQHVHMKLGGMAGSRAQLRFEFTQDSSGICSDVRPGHACGVSVDNVVMRSVVSVQPLSVKLEVRESLSRDPGTNEIVANITVTNTGGGTASNVQLTSVLLGGAATTTPLPNLGSISAGASASAAVRFPGSAGAPGAPSVLRISGSHSGGNLAASFRVILP